MNIETIVAEAVSTGFPATFVVPLPGKETYRLGELRRLCSKHGVVRFTPYEEENVLKGLLAVVEEGEAVPLIALSMIARDDVVSLERAIVSCIDQVDEIVIAVDGRSEQGTKDVALAYADTAVVFQASDIGMSPEDWAADKIHFANARNFGRERVSAPWSLVVDSDEVLATNEDLREVVKKASVATGAFNVSMGTEEFEQRDAQRLARTYFRFFSAMHNQLPIEGEVGEADAFIVHDVSLRSEAEMVRRAKQREDGVPELIEQGKRGDLSALFHAAKHLIGLRDERGVELAAEYRLRTEIHGPKAVERMWLALSAAAYYHEKEDLRNAEAWAMRVLLDGPRVEAFCLLGDIAEDEKDYRRALAWYECACVVEPETMKFLIAEELRRRFERRDGLRQFVASLG